MGRFLSKAKILGVGVFSLLSKKGFAPVRETFSWLLPRRLRTIFAPLSGKFAPFGRSTPLPGRQDHNSRPLFHWALPSNDSKLHQTSVPGNLCALLLSETCKSGWQQGISLIDLQTRAPRNKLPFMILNPQEWTAEKCVFLQKMHFPAEK